MTTIEWTPPGGGLWELETMHVRGGQPLVFQQRTPRAFREGFAKAAVRYCLPIDYLDVRFVNGHCYARMGGSSAHDATICHQIAPTFDGRDDARPRHANHHHDAVLPKLMNTAVPPRDHLTASSPEWLIEVAITALRPKPRSTTRCEAAVGTAVALRRGNVVADSAPAT